MFETCWRDSVGSGHTDSSQRGSFLTDTPIAEIHDHAFGRHYDWGAPALAESLSEADESCDVPTLRDRSDDESSTSLEEQLERLEWYIGEDAANSVRAELDDILAIVDENEEPITVSIPALRRLVDFLCAHPRMKVPYLFIAEERIKAQWQVSSYQIAWIDFDATEDVRLLVFSPDQKARGGVKRFIGTSTIQDAYSDLQSLGADWVAQ